MICAGRIARPPKRTGIVFAFVRTARRRSWPNEGHLEEGDSRLHRDGRESRIAPR
jgi:hypothetical protein